MARVTIIQRRGYVEILNLRTGNAQRLLDTPASLPMWSPDGRYISCTVWKSTVRPYVLTVVDVAKTQLFAYNEKNWEKLRQSVTPGFVYNEVTTATLAGLEDFTSAAAAQCVRGVVLISATWLGLSMAGSASNPNSPKYRLLLAAAFGLFCFILPIYAASYNLSAAAKDSPPLPFKEQFRLTQPTPVATDPSARMVSAQRSPATLAGSPWA